MQREYLRLRIKETIVVEGRDDKINLKRFLDCDIIVTNGFNISKETFKRIETAYRRNGIIIFTDPDSAGNRIRKKILERCKDAKQAFLTKKQAHRDGNIGVENASEKDILKALENVREIDESKDTFTRIDLIRYGLVGQNNSALIRDILGNKLQIGYASSKEFLKRLNTYSISREELEIALEEVRSEIN